jgi:methionyl-tRNA formyltransferase
MARLVFLGTPEIAVPALEALVSAGHDVVLVVSRPDARRGRGRALTPSPVKAAATELGIEVTEDLERVSGSGAELGVVVAYGRLIPTPLLEQVPMVNIHFSLLPRWRGAAPLERAILAGDEVTGVCLMAVAPELDTGGIYASATTPVGDKSLDVLRSELAVLGAQLLISSLREGLASLGEPRDQVGDVTYAAKIRPEEMEIDVHATAAEALRTVRLGRAFTSIGGRRLRILEAVLTERATGGASAGTLDGVTLVLREGAIDLKVVQPESRAAMAAEDWRRGLGGGLVSLGRTEPPAGSGT